MKIAVRVAAVLMILMLVAVEFAQVCALEQ